MMKNIVRFAIVLALMSFAFVSSSSAADTCTRDTTWKDGDGNPLVCYHCTQATYCYPA
jgi:hypothetical protein